jgi:hypothetical protein
LQKPLGDIGLLWKERDRIKPDAKVPLQKPLRDGVYRAPVRFMQTVGLRTLLREKEKTAKGSSSDSIARRQLINIIIYIKAELIN